jgi:hypothetical protein
MGGNWFDMKRRLLGVVEVFAEKAQTKNTNNNTEGGDLQAFPDLTKRNLSNQPSEDQAEQLSSQYVKLSDFAISNERNEIIKYLEVTRALNIDLCIRYGVGYSTQKFQNNDGQWANELCVTFPWMVETKKVFTL